MSVAQIAAKTSIPTKEQQRALQELIKIGFLTFVDGEYVVERWTEFQGDVSTERVKRFRERSRNENETFHPVSGNASETGDETQSAVSGNVSETELERKCNALDRDKEEDRDKDHHSLFSKKQEEPENLESSQLRMRARGILDGVWRAMEDLVGNDLQRESWERDNWRFALELAQSGRSDEEILGARIRASRRIGKQVIRLEIIRDQLVMERDAMRNVTVLTALPSAAPPPRSLTEEEREASDAARQRVRSTLLGRLGGPAVEVEG